MSLASYQLLHSAMLSFVKRVQRYTFFFDYANNLQEKRKKYVFYSILYRKVWSFRNYFLILHTVNMMCKVQNREESNYVYI